MKLEKVHPNIRFIAPRKGDIIRARCSRDRWKSTTNRDTNSSTMRSPFYTHRSLSRHRYRTLMSSSYPQRWHQVRPLKLLEWRKPRPFIFDELPAEAQSRIFEECLYKRHIIHCISRLDPFVPPENARLIHRFHWGPRKCSLTYAYRGRQVLSILQVCKRWYFLGTHAFYGTNSFGFSSLGELNRFFNGIGPERASRVQHVEITWVGSQNVTFEKQKENGKEKTLSLRTAPLLWLAELLRLKTLTIHIDESSEKVMRRPYEPRSLISCMKTLTQTQPNYRLFRALRNVHGMDYVYDLRGLRWVHVYDL